MAAAVVARSQPAGPRPKAAEYPAHTQTETLAIGAEFMLRSFGAGGQTYAAEDYLVVDVALYPAKGTKLAVAHGQFSLRINGGRQALLAAPPPFVAASVKYPDWEYRPRVIAGAGAGDAGVIIGRPESVGRFPGDPRPGRERLPAPPRAPAPEDRAGIERLEPVKPEEIVVREALEEGEPTHPRRGFLYFPFKGKTNKLKTVELIYNGPAGTATLKLR